MLDKALEVEWYKKWWEFLKEALPFLFWVVIRHLKIILSITIFLGLISFALLARIVGFDHYQSSITLAVAMKPSKPNVNLGEREKWAHTFYDFSNSNLGKLLTDAQRATKTYNDQ